MPSGAGPAATGPLRQRGLPCLKGREAARATSETFSAPSGSGLTALEATPPAGFRSSTDGSGNPLILSDDEAQEYEDHLYGGLLLLDEGGSSLGGGKAQSTAPWTAPGTLASGTRRYDSLDGALSSAALRRRGLGCLAFLRLVCRCRFRLLVTHEEHGTPDPMGRVDRCSIAAGGPVPDTLE